ncbi:hypothetical protein E2C01_025718 [Portunus trituberculatus]|uniref:Uncharacterized protein n=1 Tax=Portunus trituberculatus TaxID=210409 RepID=A0A5B7EGP7_PORTR|nr:hypothetical protein [Portunus trituberculatus]
MLCFENLRFIETPIDLKRLSDDNTDKDFSGFREERGNMRKLINVVREIRFFKKEVMSSLMNKQDRLTMENIELRLRLVECEKVSVINQGLKEEIHEIKKQNYILKDTCHNYENSLTLEVRGVDLLSICYSEEKSHLSKMPKCFFFFFSL